jgi:hypothetical protein
MHSRSLKTCFFIEGLLPRAARVKKYVDESVGDTAGETYYRGSVTANPSSDFSCGLMMPLEQETVNNLDPVKTQVRLNGL